MQTLAKNFLYSFYNRFIKENSRTKTDKSRYKNYLFGIDLDSLSKLATTKPSTSVEGKSSIGKNNWTKDSPKENLNTAYIFTENINSIGSSRVGGGSAVIRNNPNAIGIVTKKYYVYAEDRDTSKITGGWNQDFQDTKEDFELFKKVNLEQFAKIDKYESKIFPQGFASDLAKIPTRFAEWLQSELLNRYGLVTDMSYTCSKNALFFFVPGNIIVLLKSAGIAPMSNRFVILLLIFISSSWNKSNIILSAINLV